MAEHIISNREAWSHDRKWAVIISVMVHAGLALMLALWSWTIPMPPPPEQGVLINFGTGPDGQGMEEPSPEMAQQTPTQADITPQEKSLTQDFEDAPVLKKIKEQKKKETVASKPLASAPTEPVRQVNQRALFSGKGTSASSGEGLGNTPGNQGSLNGVANAPHGSGTGIGNGGNGNFRLQGRNIVGSLPKPQYTVNNAGTVVVEIIVNRDGNVIKANALVQGSTVQDDALFKAAEKAALRARFTNSENGADIQRGTITYHFRIQN